MTQQRLSEFSEGSVGLISQVNGSSSTATRLLEMGMVPGEYVRVIRAGNPYIIEVGDTRLCVRPHDLQEILLSTIDTSLLKSNPKEAVSESGTMAAVR